MAQYPECDDVLSGDFTYPFLAGLNMDRPPRTISIPLSALDSMGNMERQYWEIKSRYFNVLIFFKKGKFYELYDHDAVIANREFGLRMTFDSANRGKMRLAGVPEQSFSEWARLFIFRGYKVGRVEQMKENEDDEEESDTPAKKAGKFKVIRRELVEVLTPGTITDSGMISGSGSIFLLALFPCPSMGFVDGFALDLSRRAVYHCPCGNDWPFPAPVEDTIQKNVTLRKSMDTALTAMSSLLQQLAPKEIVVPEFLPKELADNSDVLQEMIKWIENDGYLVERFPALSIDPSLCEKGQWARQLITQYLVSLHLDKALPLIEEYKLFTSHLVNALSVSNEEVGNNKLLSEDQAIEKGSILSWERKFDSGMVLDSTTLKNLEIFHNLQDGSEKGTFSVFLNQCFTNGGQRLFREWLLRPSSSVKVISARQEVVQYLVKRRASHLWSLCNPDNSNNINDKEENNVLSSDHTADTVGEKRAFSRAFPLNDQLHLLRDVDFERSLSRLAEMKVDNMHIAYVDPLLQYKKNLSIILSTTEAFRTMVRWASQMRHNMEVSTPLPALLENILSDVEAAATATSAIDRLFDMQAAKNSGLVIPSPGVSPEYDIAMEHIRKLEEFLHEELAKVQKEKLNGVKASFSDLGKDLFLIEVRATEAPTVAPSGLLERTRNAKSVKYVVNAWQDTIAAYKEATKSKAEALLRVLRDIASKICEYCPLFHTASRAFSYYDCLLSLAKLYHRSNAEGSHVSFPEMVVDHPLTDSTINTATTTTAELSSCMKNISTHADLSLIDAIHPLLHAAIPNTIQFDDQGRILLLTGPNMAGKSTLMRTVAINVILGQLGGPVFAKAMRLRPIVRIFTRIGARDASIKGQSTLFVELNETSEILRFATSQTLCLIDELGRGTSTHDGLAIAHATLHALSKRQPKPPIVIFSTHYHSLAQAQQRHAAGVAAQLGYMDFALVSPTSATDEVPSITFLYRLTSGVCTRSYGIEVALNAGIPKSVVTTARTKSIELVQSTALHEDLETLKHFLKDAI